MSLILCRKSFNLCVAQTAQSVCRSGDSSQKQMLVENYFPPRLVNLDCDLEIFFQQNKAEEAE